MHTTVPHDVNDSHLFRTAAQLDAEGFYPVKGNRWQRGKELYLPLYQGRMIHGSSTIAQIQSGSILRVRTRSLT